MARLAFARHRRYVAGMHLVTGFLIFVATVAAMEGFAYVMHRWVMHGPGWFLHESHHRPRTGNWELNDLYFVIFATPSILAMFGGLYWGWGDWPLPVGIGIAGYGAIYLGFHDIIVHRRLNHRYLPKSAYMKRIISAHRLHHAVETKQGTVSFGFLWAPRPEALKAELKRRGNAGVRAPVGSKGALGTFPDDASGRQTQNMVEDRSVQRLDKRAPDFQVAAPGDARFER